MEETLQDKYQTLFVDVLLPVPIDRLFTYRVPQAFSEGIQIGQRVIVPFGDRKVLTGLVSAVHDKPPREREAKYLLDRLDPYPIVTEQQIRLYQWIAAYYSCTAGEVMNAGLPSGLKLSSESRVQLHPGFDPDNSDQPLTDNELILLNHLKKDSLSYSEISKLLGIRNLYSLIKSLVGKEAILLFEEVREKYKPKTVRKVRLTDTFVQPGALEHLFVELDDRPKQEAILLKYLQLVPVLHSSEANRQGTLRSALLDESLSESSLNTLVKNKVLEVFDEIVSRFEEPVSAQPPVVQLSEEQHRAQSEILAHFEQHPITLLHGITGSGKTEIYIHLIRKALDGGSQVLYLLPEIALTTQIVQRLKKVFGASMGVYHSRFSDNERVEVWNGILSGRFKFIVGVRSSVLLPFDNLGLIIVDEEHDPSYKQQEPAPRYNARDAALMLGQFHHAKVLLGSATPSVETYYHAHQHRYGLVRITNRFGESRLPQIEFADIRQEKKDKTLKGEFSQRLLRGIASALAAKDQVIIFQNRRGYSPMIECLDCGWVPKCQNCSVSLTYHQYRQALICHYCGYKEPLHNQCPSCSSSRILTLGYGTEKLEEELKLHFPEAHVQRMDLDTTRSKTAYESLLEKFENGDTDILVGTQMVTKGLDFDRVSLVGIFNADRMIHFPDFRSHERAFQLITQVSGRAGRRGKEGKVIVQTTHADHPLLATILHHDQVTFYETQLSDRLAHHYPPFTRLIELTVKHTDKKSARNTATVVCDLLKQGIKGVWILGPGEPIVAKIRNQYQITLLIKIPRERHDLPAIKAAIRDIVEQVGKDPSHRKSRILIDVDPY